MTKLPAVLVGPLEAMSTTWTCDVALGDFSVRRIVLEPDQVKCVPEPGKPGHVELRPNGAYQERWVFVDPLMEEFV